MITNELITDVISGVGILLTGLGAVYTGFQLQLSRKMARSEVTSQ